MTLTLLVPNCHMSSPKMGGLETVQFKERKNHFKLKCLQPWKASRNTAFQNT
jgi:hypothetical protein